MNHLIIIGLLLNSCLITFNRFIKELPNWLYLPGLILGIGLIIAGAILTKTA